MKKYQTEEELRKELKKAGKVFVFSSVAAVTLIIFIEFLKG